MHELARSVPPESIYLVGCAVGAACTWVDRSADPLRRSLAMRCANSLHERSQWSALQDHTTGRSSALPSPVRWGIRAGRAGLLSGVWGQGRRGWQTPAGRVSSSCGGVRWLSSAGLSPLYFARCADLWTGAPTSPGERIVFLPRLSRGTGGPVAGGTTRDGPVRAIRRPPLAFRQPSGLLASAARRPRSDGAIPCLCVGSMHDVDAIGFAARPRGACAGRLLADRQGSEHPTSSVAERARREASNSPWMQGA